MENKKYHTVGTVINSDGKMVETETRLLLLTNIDDHSLYWLDTYTSIKSGKVKLFIWAQASSLC
jgi:hypothetical protein